MLQTNFATIQEVRRNYKKVVKQVAETSSPTIVISNNQPQFAIVSLSMLEELKPRRGGAAGLLALAEWAEKQDFNLPADLGKNHDKYIWDK
jgi:prevent-host-death family protein